MTDRQLLETLLEKVTLLSEDLKEVKEDVGTVKGQLRETSDIVKALLHQSEAQKAQMDALTNGVARVEGEVRNLRGDINTIEVVTAKNWTDIASLKAVK